MTSSKFKLIIGDCIEILRRADSNCVDLVLTDPPHLVNYTDKSGRSIANDCDDAWLQPAFEQIARVMKPDSFCVSFYGRNQSEKFLAVWKELGLRPVGHLVFTKAYAYLLTNGHREGPSVRLNDVLPWSYSGNELHPTQKPVSALEPLIAAFSKPGDTVLDPFSGSGSTGQAALMQGRDYLGIELEAEYIEVARERLTRFGVDADAAQ